MSTLGMSQAAAAAAAFILTDALLPTWEWKGVDVPGTLLNISGSFMAGLANGGGAAREDKSNSEVHAAISIVISGFLAVWTSLLFTVEHAAHLAAVTSLEAGVGYLLGSVLLGWVVYVVAHRLGMRWRVSRKAVDWAKRGPLWLCKGAERTALLVAVAAMAWGGWMAGQHPHKLGWGVVMAVTGGVIGSWFSGLNEGGEGRIKWGDWRCNALAFAGMISAARYAASLDPEERQETLESAFFVALVAQGFGTISGFADLSADAGDLALRGDYGGAAANMILNVGTAGVALLARLKAEKVMLS
ncbi:unnamed protein product [Scytosiphon promiscuus]